MPDEIAVTRHTGSIVLLQGGVAIRLSLAQADDLLRRLKDEADRLREDQAAWMYVYGPVSLMVHLVPRATYDEHGRAVCGEPAPYTPQNRKGWWAKPLIDSPHWHRTCGACLAIWEQAQDTGKKKEI